MNKKILIAIICLFVVGLFTATYNVLLVGADSGFDTSYDSGRGWDSGSDWGGSSWDSGSSSSGESSLDPITFLLIIFGFFTFWFYHVIAEKILKIKDEKKYPKIYKIGYPFLIFFIIFFIFGGAYFLISIIFYFVIRIVIFIEAKKSKKLKEKIVLNKNTNNLLDKDFDELEFNKQVFNIYKDLQIAWMNFDYDKIKELANDEICNMYVNQLETLKIKNQQNIMSNIEYLEGYIIDYKKVNNKEIFKVYLCVSCYDYIINTKNNNIVRGNKNKKVILSYVLTFERNVEVIKYCSQCGAHISDVTECPYCRSKIVNNTSKLKMTKKEIKSQN